LSGPTGQLCRSTGVGAPKVRARRARDAEMGPSPPVESPIAAESHRFGRYFDQARTRTCARGQSCPVQPDIRRIRSSPASSQPRTIASAAV
jgi:hypothetical protein